MHFSGDIASSLREANLWRRAVFPGLIALAALGVAFIGGIIAGNAGDDGVNQVVEALSNNSASFLGGMGSLAPLGFALAAGLVSAVNPCGFAMLPAYLGLYLGANEQSNGSVHPVRLLSKALLVGGAVTAGFVVLFSVAGLVIGFGAHSFVVGATPWIGLAIGVVLAITGAWMLGGGKIYSGLASRAAVRISDPTQTGFRGYFLFGVAYGTASLSCTLPIFLIVVGTSLAVSDILTTLGQFLLYALGMGMVIMALTIGIAFFKGAMLRGLRGALPYIQPVGLLLMNLAGSYIVFYWLTVGGLK